MCGICGYAGFAREKLNLPYMTDALEHRGPDDRGVLVSDTVGIGMRRLSIIDVAGGQQPIYNEDKSLAIVFNGEIYNYRTLVDELQQRGHNFRTRSDTEAILHLYEEYGPACVTRLRGMFTFAICDVQQQRLFLARDWFGIKPLYYWIAAGQLIFGSEIKAILASNHIHRVPNLRIIDAYLSLRYAPGPETLFQGIYKLPAAHWLTWENGQVHMEQYWSPQPYYGPYQPDEAYHEQFAALFTEATRMRLMSEVPLGAFLSGGIDSSAIVATMSQLVDQPIKTFSVGFDWSGDELPAAQQVAQQLNCDHHEIICRPEDMGLLPRIIWQLDEPIGDPIVVPMYLLSQLARQHVTVVLSGEGADENLAGYFPHKVMYWARQYARWTPHLVQNWMVQPVVRHMPPSLLNVAFDYPAQLGKRGRTKLVDYLSLVGQNRPRQEYHFLISLFDERDKADLYTPMLQAVLNQWQVSNPASNGGPYLEQILGLQYDHWLQDDILMKQDKMTMAHSIEGRVPFLDHILVEFLMQTPPHLKLRGLTNKAILRQHLSHLMPTNTAARASKKPFYVPLDQYFSAGPLSELVETCLSESSVRRRGYFQWERVRALKASMGERDFLYAKQVLGLLALELWHRIFIDQESGWV